MPWSYVPPKRGKTSSCGDSDTESPIIPLTTIKAGCKSPLLTHFSAKNCQQSRGFVKICLLLRFYVHNDNDPKTLRSRSIQSFSYGH